MKAVILAGGYGERLRPLTEKMPKPLVLIGRKKCIEYVINSLVKGGFRDIIITTSYMSQALMESIGDGSRYKARVLYSFEDRPAGTAGAVKNVESFLDETFVVASGDVLADVDVKALYDYHCRKSAKATIALTKVDNPTEYGIVGLDSKSQIVRFKEKPKSSEIFSNLINAGIYVLEPDVLEYIPRRTKFDFSKQVFPRLLECSVPLFGKPIKGLWMDIGRRTDLLKANAFIVKREARRLGKKAIIDKRVKLSKGVRLKGYSLVADKTEIGENVLLNNAFITEAVIEDNVIITNSLILTGSIIKENAVIENSIIAENCVIECSANISDSIIGDGVSIKEGSNISRAKVS